MVVAISLTAVIGFGALGAETGAYAGRFDPERFSPQRSAARPRFAYLPFGGGPRICIGAQLALTEVSLLVATMAQRYRLKLVPQQDIALVHRVTLHPRDGIRMQLQRRD